MSAKKIDITVGKETPQADAPKDQEVAQGEQLALADSSDEVSGHSHFRYVTCYACHAVNQIGWHTHMFNCWNCGCHVHVY